MYRDIQDGISEGSDKLTIPTIYNQSSMDGSLRTPKTLSTVIISIVPTMPGLVCMAIIQMSQFITPLPPLLQYSLTTLTALPPALPSALLMI